MVSGISGRNGTNGLPSSAGSETARIASRGLRTTKEGKQLIGSAISEALNERIPNKSAMMAIRGVKALVDVVKAEHLIGDGDPLTLVEPMVDQMDCRRQELLKELAALDAQRAAG